MEAYGYILAELLKRNTNLHGHALIKRGQQQKWPDEAKRIFAKELCKYTFNSKLKAFSGLVWGRLRAEDITTRHIYQLLLQWALYLTQNELLHIYTSEYEDLLEELRHTIESGAEGKVEDIPSNEIIEEWELVKNNYLLALHKMVEEWVDENTQ